MIQHQLSVFGSWRQSGPFPKTRVAAARMDLVYCWAAVGRGANRRPSRGQRLMLPHQYSKITAVQKVDPSGLMGQPGAGTAEHGRIPVEIEPLVEADMLFH
jgi:hypothetical protein